MELLQQTYSVLLVNSSEHFGEQFYAMLPESIYRPVSNAGSINEAQRMLSDRAYDMIIVNTPLPDDFGVRFAIDLSVNSHSVVMLLVRADIYDAVYGKVCDSGVFVLRKPTSASSVNQSLDWLRTTRARLRRIEKKSASLQDKMEEIKLVNRAKWALITNLNMTETDAHRYIEKQAMDRCVSRRIIAESILNTYK